MMMEILHSHVSDVHMLHHCQKTCGTICMKVDFSALLEATN